MQQLPKRSTTSSSLRRRVTLSFVTLAVLFIGATIAILYLNFRQRVRDDFRQRLESIASLAALQQDGDALLRITSESDPLFAQIRAQNTKIKQADPDLVFVYVMVKEGENIYFLVDAGEDEGLAGFRERYEEPGETLLQNFDTLTKPISEPDFYTDDYGTFLSAYSPVYNASGRKVAVIGVDINAKTIQEQESQFLRISLIVFFVALALVSVFGWVVGGNVSGPISQLAQAANVIAAGNLQHRAGVKTGITEIEELVTDFNLLAKRNQELIQSLEERVKERTHQLEERSAQLETSLQTNQRRTDQLQAVAKIARTISSVQNLDELLPLITQTVSAEFDFYHTGIFLLDMKKEYALLKASNSPGGKQMLAREHRLRVGQVGIVGFVAGTGQPRIALDTGEDAVYFDNPDLPNTHSEMGLPLRSGNKVIGVLDIQSEETAAFDERDIELLSIVADQISIAIQNANQFQEAQSALEEARTAYRQYVQREWRTFIHEEKRLGYRYSPAGVGPLKARVRSNDIEIANATGQTRTSQTESQTQIVVPIKLRGEVVGVLNIKTDGFHPIDSDEVDVTEAVAERVALAMDNMRLLKTSQDQAARERTISAIASKIGASTNLKNVLQTAVEELGRIMPGADVTIQLGSNEQE